MKTKMITVNEAIELIQNLYEQGKVARVPSGQTLRMKIRRGTIKGKMLWNGYEIDKQSLLNYILKK